MLERSLLILSLLLLPALAFADPDDTYTWPCNGGQYENASLIYEAEFPGAHPGLSALTHIDLATTVETKRKRKRYVSEVEVYLVNRRGNRPEGFRQQLLYSANDSNTSLVSLPVEIELVEGDVVKIATRCTPIGKAPRRIAVLRYTLDFTGEEESNQ